MDRKHTSIQGFLLLILIVAIYFIGLVLLIHKSILLPLYGVGGLLLGFFIFVRILQRLRSNAMRREDQSTSNGNRKEAWGMIQDFEIHGRSERSQRRKKGDSPKEPPQNPPILG